jgi:hypothetical protein
MLDSDKKAATETVRQLLEQTEKLAEDANLTEVAFLIGVALASLTQDTSNGRICRTAAGTTTRIM